MGPASRGSEAVNDYARLPLADAREAPVKHAVICGVRDPIYAWRCCTKDEAHDGAHEDARFPFMHWYGGRA